MSQLIYLLLIGISLSMDAFSLSLAYGLTEINKNNKLILSLVVGLYHFIMPLIGYTFSTILVKSRYINISLIAGFVLIYVGLETILSKENITYKKNILSYLLFGLSVSIDSLTIGIGLRAITNNPFLASFIFSISSFIFTLLGLNIGTYIGKYLHKYSKSFGGIILIIIGIIMFFK